MTNKKKEVTYIGDAGVVKKKDTLGLVITIVSSVLIVTLITLGVLAFIAIEVG